MRVLQVGKYYHPYRGGMETHLKLLCEEIRSAVALEVVVGHDKPRTVRELVDGVEVMRCAEYANASSTSLCPSMPLALSRSRYDVIHIHYPNPMAVMSYLASRRPRDHAVVVTYHSDVVRQKRLLKLFAPFMHRVLRRAEAILCTSPDYIESSDVLRRYRDKCRVVPLGIDVREFESTPSVQTEAAQIRARYGKPLILAVGRLIYYKGFEFAVRAMSHVDAHLIIIGDGPLRGELEALAARCGVSRKVHFVGNQPRTAPFYHAADVFVLPSVERSEAFGIVQLEAMACGKPVVNTQLASGVPFVSVHGETGFTVPPKNAEALARALNDLLGNPDALHALGQRAQNRVEQMFTKEVMAARTLDVYREARGSRAAATGSG